MLLLIWTLPVYLFSVGQAGPIFKNIGWINFFALRHDLPLLPNHLLFLVMLLNQNSFNPPTPPPLRNYWTTGTHILSDNPEILSQLFYHCAFAPCNFLKAWSGASGASWEISQKQERFTINDPSSNKTTNNNTVENQCTDCAQCT